MTPRAGRSKVAAVAATVAVVVACCVAAVAGQGEYQTDTSNQRGC
ncbi:hypothetical protein E2C01_099939 [Portunus trituberculatus]|uniref:Uncharacterized protein n=1 Tax=Portunus trituberculatus TaxID=210409 RepID=A0A5B7K539_PORTR|nr:hypothetical protein [Portunus trituberculatus]